MELMLSAFYRNISHISIKYIVTDPGTIVEQFHFPLAMRLNFIPGNVQVPERVRADNRGTLSGDLFLYLWMPAANIFPDCKIRNDFAPYSRKNNLAERMFFSPGCF